jgi:hypothetical protein
MLPRNLGGTAVPTCVHLRSQFGEAEEDQGEECQRGIFGTSLGASEVLGPDLPALTRRAPLRACR